MIRLLADEPLAIRHLKVKVIHHGDHLVTLGDVRAPWWQRRATRSRHIRLGSLKGAWTSARSRLKSSEPVLPNSSMVPARHALPDRADLSAAASRHHDPRPRSRG